MKKIFIIIPILLFCFVACKNKESKKSVIGKWRPVEVTLKDMSEKEQQDLINNAVIELTADGKFIHKKKDDTHSGTYTFNEKDNTLTASSSSGDEGEQKFIVTWEGDNMVMTNEEGVVKLKRE